MQLRDSGVAVERASVCLCIVSGCVLVLLMRSCIVYYWVSKGVSDGVSVCLCSDPLVHMQRAGDGRPE